MNSQMNYDSQPYEQQQLYWQANVQSELHSAPSSFSGQLSSLPEHGFMPRPAFEFDPMQHPQRGFLPPDAYRGTSPASASPSGGSSPWSTASFPTQDVMAHPDVDISKFHRGSRGSMSSLALPSMHSSRPAPSNTRAYTPSAGPRPHAMSFSHIEVKEENPWNLVSWQPFHQDGANPGAAAFFLRSPTPTKRQRTNQACEKCRERKAKCNGARPTCQRCQARGHICEYAKERRMRGPNKTGGRRPSADIEDAVDLLAANGPASVSETTAGHRADSPTSSSSHRSSSEVAQDPSSSEQSKATRPGSSHLASRARSDSDSPASQASVLPSLSPAARDRQASTSRAGIALPTLSNGNLSLHYAASSRVEHHQRAASSESALRYAQSMPQIGYRFGQDAFLREEHPAGVWSSTLDAQPMSDISSHSGICNNDEPADYPPEMQTIHYSVSDVSSSSTPITPDRFEYAWPSNDGSTQQSTFQFAHPESKPAPMLPTLSEFDAEANELDPLREWAAETHADDHPVIMA